MKEIRLYKNWLQKREVTLPREKPLLDAAGTVSPENASHLMREALSSLEEP